MVAAPATGAVAEIDHRTASVQGTAALGAWRADAEGRAMVSLAYDVHLARADRPWEEIQLPAGMWQLPAPNRYLAWLEGDHEISPYQALVGFAHRPYEGRGFAITLPVVPAGRVRLDPAAPRGQLRLMHAESHLAGGRIGLEFLRWVPRERATTSGVQMPAGTFVASLWDEASNEYLAFGRPQRVETRRQVVVSPRPPASGRADVLVLLRRSQNVGDASEDDVQVQLVTGDGKALAPELRVPSGDSLYAFWYDVPSGRARVEVSSRREHLPPQDVALRSGRAERVDLRLNPAPSLGLTLEMPAPLEDSPVRVELVDRRSGRVAEVHELPGAGTHRLAHAPAAPLTVWAQVGEWEAVGEVDLSDGRPGEVTLRLDLVTLSGTVYLGKRPTAARLAFKVGKREPGIVAHADEHGNYQVVLPSPASARVTIDVPGRDLPVMRLLDAMYTRDAEHDFHLGDNDYRAAVRDEVTGEPIAGATVLVENRATSGFVTSFTATTDEQGEARFQPLDEGELAVFAQADGYERSDLVEQDVRMAPEARTIDLVLTPVGERHELRIALAGGAPAAGARVLLFDAAGNELVSVPADARGVVRLPRRHAGSAALVRHEAGALLVRRWQGESDAVWQLAPPPPPLRLQVHDTAGSPVPWGRVALWLDGAALPPPVLSRALGRPSADGNGGIDLPGVGCSGLEVLAWAPASGLDGLAASGALDAQRTRVACPSPPVVAVRALD